jgi:hypothetical protein
LFSLAKSQAAPYDVEREGYMDRLALFGLFAVTAMLVCYALEDRSPWFVFGFAAACALGSAYGFLQGAWPFGLLEAIWSIVALQRWRRKSRSSSKWASVSGSTP